MAAGTTIVQIPSTIVLFDKVLSVVMSRLTEVEIKNNLTILSILALRLAKQ